MHVAFLVQIFWYLTLFFCHFLCLIGQIFTQLHLNDYFWGCLHKIQILITKNSVKVSEDDLFLHFSNPVIPPSEAAVVLVAPYRGRSLWIWTVWWWLRSLSAAGRWSDLPSRWWNPPHSWESKPSGSTRLPLQQETGNRKSERELLWIVLFFNFTWRWKRIKKY